MSAYETIIGLEIHLQLNTKSKAFAADDTTYGAPPNTQVSPITLGHPGTLPKLNKQVVRDAILLGLAMNCDINPVNRFARKNYFYADLPKGYQISQFDTPICTGGHIVIDTKDGEKTIGITRIHMEEDAGKSLHNLDPYHTLVDLNRAGVPLLEIVTEPDMRNPEEAYHYILEVRRLVRFLGICDGNMEEGSLRCDANVSVRPVGQKEFGQKVEVKNMNSIRNVRDALAYEVKRQIEANEKGEPILQETRTFDAAKGKTLVMRTKEDAHDYRYFTEPDLPPVHVTPEWLAQVRAELPELPRQIRERYRTDLGLSDYDAGIVADDKEVVAYFEALMASGIDAKTSANWVMGPLKSWMNTESRAAGDYPIAASAMASVIQLVKENKVSHTAAMQQLIPAMEAGDKRAALDIARELDILLEQDTSALESMIAAALEKFPDKVDAYRSGKKGLLGLFMGEVMKASGGKADPKLTNSLLRAALEQD